MSQSTVGSTRLTSTYGFSIPFRGADLERAGASLATQYQSAGPFPHIVIDGFFDDQMLRAVLAEFPRPEDDVWRRYRNADERKLACNDWHQLGPATRTVLSELNAGPFIAFLQALTGIDHLLPDPYLVGGGLHQIEQGGRLGIHADFNRHRTLALERRLNALIYLNESWNEEWGGDLELWDREMSRPVVRIAPRFNRLVVFSTTRHSYHGHPRPLACPPHRTRRSLALYFYSVDRPTGEDDFGHTTIFRSERGTRRSVATRLRRLKNTSLRFVPPIVFDAGRVVRSRSRR